MKNFLLCRYRWMVVSPEGNLTPYKPSDSFLSTRFHLKLEEEFPTREDAIEAYADCVNNDVWEPPRSMVLVEEHHVDINWEE